MMGINFRIDLPFRTTAENRISNVRTLTKKRRELVGSKHEADEFVSFLEAIETVKRMLQQRITTRQDLQYTLGKSHQKSANFSN